MTEEGSQEVSQQSEVEQDAKVEVHPDQLEMWSEFQRKHSALKKARERASRNSQDAAADAPMVNTVLGRVEQRDMLSPHMKTHPDTLRSAAETSCR